MAWHDRILTSILGRRLGLQNFTTSQHGGRVPGEFIVGAEQVRMGVTTGETTSVNLLAWGVSMLPATSANSSAVFTLDPPIPGVRKVINVISTAVATYVKTKNAETINSSIGTTQAVIKSTAGGAYELIGLTTGTWGAVSLGTAHVAAAST